MIHLDKVSKIADQKRFLLDMVLFREKFFMTLIYQGKADWKETAKNLIFF